MKKEHPRAEEVMGKRNINNELTLRDYFAAKAMQGFCADQAQWYNLMMDRKNSGIKDTNEYAAQQMYKIADAMLKQRNK